MSANPGVVANNVLAWKLADIDCSDMEKKETRRTSEGPPPVYTTTFMTASRWTLQRRRKLVGVTKFTPENGNFRKGFDLETGGGWTMTWIDTAKQWLCVQDKLEVVDEITGECVQVQVWQYNSPYEVVDETEWQVTP